jgi:hypothetical protein
MDGWPVLTTIGSGSISDADVALPERCWLSADDQSHLLHRLAGLDVRGGMVYDALVGAASLACGRVVLSRDRRAARTYDLVGAAHEFVV